MKLWKLSFTVYICVLNPLFLCKKIDDHINESQIKRKLEQQKAYFLRGFESVTSVPVTYPEDICLLPCNGTTFATALHWADSDNTQKLFTTFRHTEDSFQIEHQQSGDPITRIDCASFHGNAYVLFLFGSNDFTYPKGTCTVFELLANGLRPIQHFDKPFQLASKFVLSGGRFFLVQIYSPQNQLKVFNCAVFEWSGYQFEAMGQLPCSNVSETNLFTIKDEVFVIVGVYAKKLYSTVASVLYRWDQNLGKFNCHQKFTSSKVVDLKYFQREIKGEEQHLLIIGNERKSSENNSSVTDSTIWKYTNGRFIPTYMLQLSSNCKFVPLEGAKGQFVLMVPCQNQGTLTFEFNGVDLVKSNVEFTRDISKLRPYYRNNDVYIVVSHYEVIPNDITYNDANVFIVKFEKSNPLDLKYEIIDWWRKTSPEFTENDVEPMWKKIHDSISSKSSKSFGATGERLNIISVEVQMFLYPEYNITKQFWRKIFLCGKVISMLETKLKLHEGANNLLPDEFDKTLQATIKLKELKLKGHLSFHALNNLTREEMNVNSVSGRHVVAQNMLSAPKTVENVQPLQSFLRIDVTSLKVLGQINTVESLNFESTFLNRDSTRQSFNNILYAKRFQAKSITTKNVINGIYTSQVVRTSGTSFIVNQDVLFAKPLYAQHVIINERLNNIHVLQGELNVLYTKISKPQTITTSKTFENVKLLEPIVLQGQIQSSTLDIMNPVSTIHNNILLEGDYVITGPVTISNILKTYDILDAIKLQNFVKLLRDGIRIDSTEIDLNLLFIHTIRSKSMEATSINKLNSGDLLLTGTSESQSVEGRKIFVSDLHVHNGTINAVEINAINVDELADVVLKYSGQQIIEGIVHFKRIIAPRLHHNSSPMFKSIPFDNILTASTVQNISSSVVTKQLNTYSMKITNLREIQNLFGINFGSLLNDSIYNGKHSNILGSAISYSQLYVHSLFALNVNAIKTRKIRDTIISLVSNAEVRKTVQFSLNTAVSSLYFTGKVNNVSKSDLALNWLLKDFDQTFEISQTFARVKCSNNLLLNNSINGQQLNLLSSKTTWTDKKEALVRIVFEKSTYVYESLKENLRNSSLYHKETFLLSEASFLQQIDFLSCYENMFANKILELEYINDIHTAELVTFFAYPLDHIRITVKEAKFNKIPFVTVVNNKKIKDILIQAWFTNENIVLERKLWFDEVLFEGTAFSESTINDANLLDLANTYLSLTSPQTINTELHVKNTVVFENALNVRTLDTAGNITDFESNASIDLLPFVSNTLIKDYNQKITGSWNFNELMVPGDLKNVLLNNLNICNDVMRYDATTNNITAMKIFQNVAVQRLHCAFPSTINQVLIDKWMEESILVYGNYTIQGITSFQLPNIYSNIEVLGTVNDMHFIPDIILINNTHQNLQGNVNIITKYPEDNKILPLVFENLHVQSLQRVKMENFFDCLAKSGHTTMHGNLVFRKSLNVNCLGTKESLFNINTKKFLKQYSGGTEVANKLKAIQSFKKLMKTAVEINGTKISLSRFQNIQSLNASWIKTIKYSLNTNNTAYEFIGVVERGNEACIQFYIWNHLEKMLTHVNDFMWCASDDAFILDMQNIQFPEKSILLALVGSDEGESFVLKLLVKTGNYLKTVNYVNIQKDENFSVLNINEDPCLLIHSSKNVAVKIVCLEYGSTSYELIDRGYLQMSVAEKIYAFENAVLASSETRMEIWYPYKTIIPKQITLPSAIISMDTAQYRHYKYIAVLLYYGSAQSLEIYRSRSNEDFVYFQSLETHNVVKLKLVVHEIFKNFILYGISNKIKPSVIIYKFEGVSGFVEFTKIPSSKEIWSVNDYDISRHQLLLVTTNETTHVIELL